MKGKIVFISHEASFTGAPIILLNTLRYLKGKIPYDFVVVLPFDGPLRKDFQEVSEVIIYNDLMINGRKANILQRFRLRNRYDEYRIRGIFSKYDIKLIFSNTIVNGNLVDNINYNKVPVITYVHELAHVIQEQDPIAIRKVMQHTTQFLTGSDAVKRNLLNMGVSEDIIKVMPSSIPYDKLISNLSGVDINQLRAELNLQVADKVIIAIGAAEWRKGNDLFIQLAKNICGTHSDVHFVWVGVKEGSSSFKQMQYDIEHLGIKERVHLIPVIPDALKYLALADIFVLTSREDPFPVVILEAAAAGKPIVCFADTGGSPDFVGTANGVVVPYGNIEAMQLSLIVLLFDEKTRTTLGENARQLVRKEYNVSVVADRIGKVIGHYAK